MGNLRFLAGLVAAVAMSGQAPATEPAAELLIRVRPPAGDTQPVRLESAQLLLAWWGYTEEVPLAHRYEAGELVVTVPLNREVLSSLGEMPPPDFAYVYFEFDGFVPVRSEQFYWLGGSAPTGPRESWETVTEVQFRFRGGPTVAIRNGERRDVSLQARRPVAKQVRFLDDLGRPFSGITVDSGVFWSMNNHCGYPGGLKPLFADRRPDEDGVVTVPDGDVEYGFRVKGDDHSSIIGGESHDPTFVTTFIDAPELLVRIRRHRRVPLTVRVSIGGTPAAGVMVSASVKTACMNGTGALGRTGDRGVLRVPDFYPEEFDAVCIGGVDGHPDGRTNSIVPSPASPPWMVPAILSSPTVRSQRSNAAVRPGRGVVFKLNLRAVRTPSTGIVASSRGPIRPVTLSPVCFRVALPVIVPSTVVTVTAQCPLTSTRSTTGAKAGVSKATPIRSRMVMAYPPPPAIRGRRRQVHKAGSHE